MNSVLNFSFITLLIINPKDEKELGTQKYISDLFVCPKTVDLTLRLLHFDSIQIYK